MFCAGSQRNNNHGYRSVLSPYRHHGSSHNQLAELSQPWWVVSWLLPGESNRGYTAYGCIRWYMHLDGGGEYCRSRNKHYGGNGCDFHIRPEHVEMVCESHSLT